MWNWFIIMGLIQIAEQILELLFLEEVEDELNYLLAWLQKNDAGQEIEELASMYSEHMGYE